MILQWCTSPPTLLVCKVGELYEKRKKPSLSVMKWDGTEDKVDGGGELGGVTRQ